MLRPGFRNFVLAATVGLFHLAINRPVLDFDWVYFDDEINILLNPHLTGGSWETIKWAWTDLDYTRRYMPLGWMLFDALFGMGGLNPAFYHATSWVLSAVNGILLFHIVCRYYRLRNPSDGWTDMCALIAVVLLAAHPWRAEPVGWSSGLLYLAGQFLASFAVLAAFARRQLLAAGLYLMAQLLYPVFLSLPLVMLILAVNNEAGPMRQRWMSAFRQYGLWLALAAGTGALNWFAATSAKTGFPSAGLTSYPISDRLSHFAALTCHYLGRLFWPGDTSPFYGTPAELGRHGVPIIISLGIVLTWIFRVAQRPLQRGAWTILGLVFACLLPFTGLFDQNQTASDRYAFLLLSVLGGGIACLLTAAPRGAGRWLAVGGTSVLIVALLPAHRRALIVWTDTDHLQARLDQANASHPHARINYAKPAITAHLLGNPDEARKRLEAGRSLLGVHPEILAADEFIRQTDELISSRPQSGAKPVPYALLHLDLANAHRLRGHRHAAEVHVLFARRLSNRHATTARSP